MKKIIPLILMSILSFQMALSQVIYSPLIDSVKNLVSPVSISLFDRELSGDTTTIIGGVQKRIYSRKYNSAMNPVAAQYIYEKFQNYGMNVRYQYNNATNINVIAKKTGSKYPNKQIIICAHYDDYCDTPPDTVPGADDNASGVCCVLEAARLLNSFNSDYTMIFIAFDEEEMGLYGSMAYVDSAYNHGDSIMAVFNLDMIAYDGNNDGKFRVYVNAFSENLADDFIAVNQVYNIGFNPIKLINENKSGSDHWHFWRRGYKAFLGIEDDFNPYYHTPNDKFSAVNVPYFTRAVKNSIATLMSWAIGYRVELTHNPIRSGLDTTMKYAVLKFKSSVSFAAGNNAPRLYYKIDNGNYQFVNPVMSAGDSMKFVIPGFQGPRKISYYFALQDSAGTTCISLPYGGSSISPPGTIPPPSQYIYYVFSNTSSCSNSAPKPITDMQFTYDTITIVQPGNVDYMKLNLNIIHPNDGDLFISLRAPNSTLINLSQFNGIGGANFTNTTFDDSASVSITEGTPPFTGSYRPQTLFGTMNNSPINGKWVLRIIDWAAGNQGTLQNWCLIFRYYVPISVNETTEPVSYSLEQNFPNPFNPTTNIKFSIGKKEFVTLKVYDALGREVSVLVNSILPQGNYFATWNASDLSSGIYYYRLQSDNFNQTKRMVLVK